MRRMRRTRGWRLSVVGIVTAISVIAVSSATSATQALSYSRLAVTAVFYYEIDYGSNPDSVFNGDYNYLITYRVNAIVVFDGRTLWAPSGSMLADGGASVDLDMTEWRGPSSRRPVRCSKPGSHNGRGQVYESDTKGGRFSGGGGVGVSNQGLTVNPGRKIVWSIGCAATESLETHGLPGGPSFRIPPPAKSRFTGRKPFGLGCKDRYSHGWDPAAGVPNAHTFQGNVDFRVRFTPFPASQLAATKQRLRDLAGKPIHEPSVTNLRACP